MQADFLHAAASRPPPTPAPDAILLGAVGSLGEALMARLLASSAYSKVFVGVERAMPSTSSRFAALPVSAAANPASWPAAADCFLCETPPGTPLPAGAPIRAFAAGQLLAVARQAKAAGVKRFVLVAPLAAILQLSGAVRTLSQTDEIELVGLGFESLVIVRPSAEEDDGPVGGWFRALVRSAGRAVLHIMLPPQVQPLRASTAASAILEAVRQAGPGISILGAKDLAARAEAISPGATPRARRRW